METNTTVEKQILEFQTNNDDFRRQAEDLADSLDKIKKGLKFEGAEEGFDAINDAVKDVKFDGMIAGVDEAGKKFNWLEQIAIGALRNIGAKIEDLISDKLLGVFTSTFNKINEMNPFSGKMLGQGWEKYEDSLKSFQTIYNNAKNAAGDYFTEISDGAEQVHAQLDKLMLFTDETSYSYESMISNIGKFTSNSIDLETAVSSMIGIANAAGLAGASINDASHAMDGFSKAMGMGYMSLQNWQWIRTAHMDTTQFKQILIESAEELERLQKVAGETEEETYWLTAEGNEVSSSNFLEALKDKWMDVDVMNKALARFGTTAEQVFAFMEEEGIDTVSEAIAAMKELKEEGVLTFDELGMKAFEAAQVARTFTDVIESVKDAVSSKWMKIFELALGDYQESVEMWTELSGDLWEIFAGPLDSFTSVLDEWRHFTKAANEVSGTLYNGSGDFVKKAVFEFDGREDLIRGLTYLWKTLYQTIMNVREIFNDVFPPTTAQHLFKISKAFGDFGEKVYKTFAYIRDLSEESGLTDVVNAAADAANTIGSIVHSMEEIETKAKNVIRGDYGSGEKRIELLTKEGYLYEEVQNKVNELLGCSYRYNIEEAKKNSLGQKYIGTLAEETEALEDYEEETIKVIPIQQNFAKSFADAMEEVTNADNLGEKLYNTIYGIAVILRVVKELLLGLVNKVLIPLGSWVLSRLIAVILNITSAIADFVIGIAEATDIINLISTATDNLHDGLMFVLGGIDSFFSAIFKGISSGEGFNKFLTKASEVLAYLGKVLGIVGESIKTYFGGLKDSKAFATIEKFFIDAGDFLFNVLSHVPDVLMAIAGGVALIFGTIYTYVRDSKVGQYITQLIDILSKFAGRINEFLHKITFDDILNDWNGVVEKLKASFEDVDKVIKDSYLFKLIQDNFLTKLKNFKLPEGWLTNPFKNALKGMSALFNLDPTELIGGLGLNASAAISEAGGLTKLERFLAIVNNFKTNIGQNLKGLFDLAGGSILGFQIPEWLTTLLTGIKWKNLTTFVKTFFSEFNLGLGQTKANLSLNANLANSFTTAIEKGFGPLGEQVKKLLSPLKKLFDIIHSFTGDINIKEILGWGKSFAQLFMIWQGGKMFTAFGKGFLDIAAAIGRLAGGFENIAAATAQVIRAFEAIPKSIAGVFDAFKGMFKGIGKFFNAAAVLNMALAVVALAGALWLIAQIPQEKLKNAVITLGILFAMVLGASVGLGFIGWTAGNNGGAAKIFVVALAIVAMVGAIMLIIEAFDKLKGVDWDEFKNTGLKLAIIMVVVTAVGIVVAYLTKSMNKEQVAGVLATALLMLSFAMAVNKLVDAMGKIADMDQNSINKSLSALLKLIGLFAVFTLVAGKVNIGGSWSLLGIVLALYALVKILKAIQKEDIPRLTATLLQCVPMLLTVIALGKLASGKYSWGLGPMLIGMAGFLLAFSVTLHILKGISPGDLAKGTAAISAIILMLALLVKATQDNGKYAVRIGVMFTALAISLIAVTACIWALSHMDPKGVAVGVAAIDSIILALAMLAYSTKFTADSKIQLLGLVVAIVAIAGALLALSFIEKDRLIAAAASLTTVLVAVAAVVGTLALLSKTMNILSFVGTIAAIGLIVGALAGLLYLINVQKWDISGLTVVADALIKIAAAIGIMVAAFAGLSAVSSLLSVSAGSILASIGVIAVVAAALGGIAWVLGEFGSSDMVEKINTGMEAITAIMTGIGEMIGGFIGGLLGKGIEQLLSYLPAIGDTLSKFMDNISGVKPEAVKSAKYLTEAIALIAAGTFLTIIADFVNFFTGTKTTIGRFTETVVGLGTAIKKFSAEIEGVTNINKVKIAADAIKILASVDIGREGGLLQWIIGKRSSFEDFGNGLIKMAEAVKKFAQYIIPFSGLFESKAIDHFVSFVTKMNDMKDSLGLHGGWIQQFTGDTDWTSFTDGLDGFATAMITFAGTLQDNADAFKDITPINNFSAFVGNLATMQQQIKDGMTVMDLLNGFQFTVDSKTTNQKGEMLTDSSVSYGIKTQDKWTQFVTGLDGFFGAIEKLSKILKEKNEVLKEGLGNFDTFKKWVDNLVALKASLPDEPGSLVTFFAGGNGTWDGFSIGMTEFAEGVYNYAQKGSQMSTTGLETAKTAANDLIDIANRECAYANLTILGDNIAYLGDRLQYFSEATAGADFGNMEEGATAFLNNMATMMQGDEFAELTAALSGSAVEVIGQAMTQVSLETMPLTAAAMLVALGEALINDENRASMFIYTAQLVQIINDGMVDVIALNKFAPTAVKIVQKIQHEVEARHQDIYNIGKYITLGIAEGIGDAAAVQACCDAAVAAVQAAVEAAQHEAGITSPSKLFRDEVGYWLTAGAAEGISDGAFAMAEASRESVSDALTAASDELSKADFSGKNTSMAITPVMDLDGVRTSYSQLGQSLNGSYALKAASAKLEVDSQYSNFDKMLNVMNGIYETIQNGGDVYIDGNVVAGYVNRRLGAV